MISVLVANLIITIITIALVAIAAIMGIYYGGAAYQQGQIKAAAAAILLESRQILAAERLWSFNNGLPDMSNGDTGVYGADGLWTPDYSDPGGAGISSLIEGKELAEWPAIGGSLAPASPVNGDQTTAGYDVGCYSMNGYKGLVNRILFTYNSGNYVMYQFFINTPYSAPCSTVNGNFSASTTDTSQANHPIIQIAKMINSTLGQVPTIADTATVPYVGIPRSPVGSVSDADGINAAITSGVITSNYCYIYYVYGNSFSPVNCVFGPS